MSDALLQILVFLTIASLAFLNSIRFQGWKPQFSRPNFAHVLQTGTLATILGVFIWFFNAYLFKYWPINPYIVDQPYLGGVWEGATERNYPARQGRKSVCVRIDQTYSKLSFDLESNVDEKKVTGRSVPVYHLWYDSTLRVWRLEGRFYVATGDDGFYGFDLLKLEKDGTLGGTYWSLRDDGMHHGFVMLRRSASGKCRVPDPQPVSSSALNMSSQDSKGTP
jgi:hypothetical protein